jgi:stress-induced morphogen
MLLAIAVFVLHAPAEVVCAPNLQYPCINQFKQCLQSNNIAVSRLYSKHRIMKRAVQSMMKNTLYALNIDHGITALGHSV